MGALGFACLYTPILTATGSWFGSNRGLAIGIVTAGGTLGQGLTTSVLQILLDRMDWRGACAVLGTTCLVALAPAIALMMKLSGAGAGTTASAPSWRLPPAIGVPLLCAAAVLFCACMAVPLVHLLPCIVDIGRSPARRQLCC
jgi:predicted MFS family arabinose efflux permease